jgi:hypothetical protein
MNLWTRGLSLIFFATSLSAVPACSGEAEDLAEAADAHHKDPLDPTFDDGLRAWLSVDPDASSPLGPQSLRAAACPHVDAILKWGLHPLASDRLRCAGITAARITQTIGGAPASAGTHLQDGVADGHPYSAATDLSVSGLSDAQVKTLLTKLDSLGFAAFFRNPGHDGWPTTEARHVHAVFAGAKMKASLQSQIADFEAGKNGLASHTAYTFYQPPADVKAYIKTLFNAAN